MIERKIGVRLCRAAGCGIALAAAAPAAGQAFVPFAHDRVSLAADPDGLAAVDVESRFLGYQAGVDRDLTGGEPAYDYSAFLMRDGGTRTADGFYEGGNYRLFTGGRYRDRLPNGTSVDGDHIFGYYSKNGTRLTGNAPADWQNLSPPLFAGQERPSPLFLQPRYVGDPGKWYSDNTLEPEVMKVNGTYYLYSQVEVRPGEYRVDPGVVATHQADRIQLHTSTNGSDFARAALPGDRGVVVNLPPATRAGIDLGHQEMAYVPFDDTGRPYWMYVRYFDQGEFKGHVRIRSDDPTTFDWDAREAVSNFAELGNQVGYIPDAGGAPMYVRITQTPKTGDPDGRRVPTLQFSRDGTRWTFGAGGPVELEGSADDVANRSTYFLGISTIEGTGEVERGGLRRYKLLYAASTANGPTAANNDIFASEIGLGEMVLTLRPSDAGDATLADAGFESPRVEAFQYQPTGGAWTFSPRSGVVRENLAFAAGVPASDGEQLAFLQGDGEIAQLITDLVAGDLYRVEFEAAGRDTNPDHGGTGLLSVLIEDADGNDVQALLDAIAVPSGEGLVTYFADFVAPADAVRLRFLHAPSVAGADLSTVIDAVRVMSNGAAPVPEPSTALAACGVAGLLLRRRRSAR